MRTPTPTSTIREWMMKTTFLAWFGGYEYSRSLR